MPTEPKPPTLAQAIIPFAALIATVASSLAIFGLAALDGPVQVGLILCCMIVGLLALKNGNSWEDVQKAGQSAMSSITSAVFILLAVGALIGTWNMSGTIPTLVYFGIQVMAPQWFYVATALVCGLVAMSIGSSWTTAATVGVGLVGIATMLGVSPAVTAGAVISGAYLGDKTSPLSETTILTAQMVKVDVMTHIKSQAWTSIPAFLIALVGFTAIGLTSSSAVVDEAEASVELASLDQVFNISVWNLLPMVLLVLLSARRVPASIALMCSAIFAGVLAAFLQPRILTEFVGTEGGFNPLVAVKATWQAMATGFVSDTGIGDIDRLLSRGGMDSMLITLWLIIGAVTFGALMDELGFIEQLTKSLIGWANTQGRLYLAVFASALGLNIVAGDQYIALVLPARTFRAEFERRGLAPTNLSRLCADSGTVTSPLVPWNSCGAFMGATLGVSTLLYLPYCLFNLASPALSVLYGFTGFKILNSDPIEQEADNG